VSLIPESMAFALPDRAKTLNVLETLAIGAAGGALFLWAHLPGGLISGAMIAVGTAAILGRPLRVPALLTQTVLVPRHSDYDWSISSQSRMGMCFGATRIWMLRATPG
jgi:hypothetical protein